MIQSPGSESICVEHHTIHDRNSGTILLHLEFVLLKNQIHDCKHPHNIPRSKRLILQSGPVSSTVSKAGAKEAALAPPNQTAHELSRLPHDYDIGK